jgi:hypothetical protein
MEPGVSVAGGREGSTGRMVGRVGIAVCVAAGFGRSAYAHRFSCVAVGEANSTLIDALAGDVPIKKIIRPTLMQRRTSHKPATIRMRLVGRRALMASC